MSNTSKNGSENVENSSNSSEVKSIHQNNVIPANNMNIQPLPNESLAITGAPSLNQQDILLNDSHKEPKYLFHGSHSKDELTNPSIFKNNTSEKPEEEINSKENKKKEGDQGHGKEKEQKNGKKENEIAEKSKKSEKDRKSYQHSVSSEYQYVSTESLNNLFGKIDSLNGEMKELNSNESNLIRLLTRKKFP